MGWDNNFGQSSFDALGVGTEKKTKTNWSWYNHGERILEHVGVYLE